MIKVQIINKGHQPLPAFATPQSAGMDLRANIDEAIVLHPMERRLVPTGLYMALPAGYEAQSRPRSGLALLAKHEQCDFIDVNELDETERGAGGYGHTGVK